VRQTSIVLASILLMLPVGLVALSAPAAASTIHRHHHVLKHRVLSHRVTHPAAHAAVHRHTNKSVAAAG
jgi:hypothetical protein